MHAGDYVSFHICSVLCIHFEDWDELARFSGLSNKRGDLLYDTWVTKLRLKVSTRDLRVSNASKWFRFGELPVPGNESRISRRSCWIFKSKKVVHVVVTI